MTPDEYCHHQLASSGSSFHYSFLFLPPSQRRAITAVYAFCRAVDNVVDGCSDLQIARVKLDWWREEIANTFRDRPSHPVCHALLPAIREFELPEATFADVIAGMSMDLGEVRYATFDDLRVYCERVASTVGLLSIAIFGYRDPGTRDFARELGLALQLTNIIRDVGEDARRHRVYLPEEDLARFRVSRADILDGRDRPELRALLAHQARRALGLYASARRRLPERDRTRQLPGLIMARIYETLLAEIAADGYRVLTRRTALPALRKLWIAWNVRRRERRRNRGRR